MTSFRPYLVRAYHDWIQDNGFTPYILVDASVEGVEVPAEYIQNGQITLNISSVSVLNLQLENDWVSFSARFSGVEKSIFIPPRAIVAIYARENGEGMTFPPETDPETPPPAPQPPAGTSAPGKIKKSRPTLKIVK